MKNQISIQQELENKLAELQNRFALASLAAPVYVAPAPVEVIQQQTTTKTMKPEVKTVEVPADFTAPSKRVVVVPADYAAPQQIDAEWTAMTELATSLSGLDLDYPRFPIKENQKETLASDLKAARAAGRKAIRPLVKAFKSVESNMSEVEISVSVAQIKNLEVATVEASLQVSQASFVYVSEVAAAPAVVTVGDFNTSVESTACLADIKVTQIEMAAIIKEIKAEIEDTDPSEIAKLEAEIESVEIEAARIISNVKATLAGRIRIRRTTISNAITINETSAQFRARALEELLQGLMTDKQAAKQAKAQAAKANADKAPKVSNVNKSISQAERKAAHKAAVKEAKALKNAKQSAFKGYRSSISEAKFVKVAKAAKKANGKNAGKKVSK